MKISTRTAIRFATFAGAAALIAACKTTPPPEAPMQNTPMPQTSQSQQQQQPTTQPQQPRPQQQVQQAPLGQIAPGSVQDFVVNVGDRIFFDLDSYTIRGDARPVLDAQAAWLARYPQVSVRLEGNADERGTREYNFALGERRANAVRDYLISRGVPAGRIETVSYGKERPIDGGSNEAAWQRNRNTHTAITGGAR